MNQQNITLKKDRQEAINWLIEHFPAAFFQNIRLIKPLKLGIFDDIVDFYERLNTKPFSKKILRDAIGYYSISKAYLSCQKPNTPRIDLFGNEVDVVTEDQAIYANKRYEQRYQKKQEISP